MIIKKSSMVRIICSLMLFAFHFAVAAQSTTEISTRSGNNSVLLLSGNIKFTILGNVFKDQTTVGFSSSATMLYDAGLDSLKAANTNTQVPSVSSVSGAVDYFRNILPSTANSIKVPLRVIVGMSGKYVLIRDSSLVLPLGACLFLEDLATGGNIDLLANASYSFTIEDTTSAPRFLVHITQPVSMFGASTSCSYKQNGMAIINGPFIGNWTSILKDNIGNVLTTHTNVFASDTLKNLAPGKYPIQIIGTLGACNSANDTITVSAMPSVTISPLLTNETCLNAMNGEVNASLIVGGTAPFSYLWSNGTTLPINDQLSAGVYMLYLTDANGCKDTTIYSVYQLSNLNASFAVSSDSVFLPTAAVTMSNQSGGYNTLLWDFGDGNSSNLANPTHSYSGAGTFTVELIASDNNCIEKTSKIITVLNPTGISAELLSANISIATDHTVIKVTGDLVTEESVTVSLISSDGRLLEKRNLVATHFIEIMEPAMAVGVYIVNVSVGNRTVSKKVVLTY